MFIEFEMILSIVAGFVFCILIIPVVKPLFGKKWEDLHLEDAKAKHKRAQKLLMAAELEAKALETEIKADEVRENVLNDKLNIK